MLNANIIHEIYAHPLSVFLSFLHFHMAFLLFAITNFQEQFPRNFYLSLLLAWQDCGFGKLAILAILAIFNAVI